MVCWLIFCTDRRTDSIAEQSSGRDTNKGVVVTVEVQAVRLGTNISTERMAEKNVRLVSVEVTYI